MGYDVFKLHILEFGAFDEAVEIIDIRFFVLSVMEFHCLAADYRLECVFVVR